MAKAFVIITTTNSSLSEAKVELDKEVDKVVARAAADKAEKEEKEEKEEEKAEKPDGDTTSEE
ncbi:hypothetical protein CEP51_005146 [Fusarium floridanum]|uniref:Uncharacterized protein n=1 Tax=Fusarium floridanum TaxID=1325733 RepID=A0A428RXU1_9HYPO|nr:hypothetical protein CEP51_005146 [Fusarium floridanum]